MSAAVLLALALATAPLSRPPVAPPAPNTAHAELRSPPYWAVILRSGPACSLGPAVITEAQARFPAHEVFSTDFECAPEANVTFDGVTPGVDFVAVYAGPDRRSAERVLAEARRLYPGANLRRLRTVAVAP